MKNTIIENTQYYIWWLLNCSQKVQILQLANEIDSIIEKLERSFFNENEIISEELETLKEIRFNDYNIALYISAKELEKEMHEDWLEELRLESDKFYAREEEVLQKEAQCWWEE
jgi:hypothetical protein